MSADLCMDCVIVSAERELFSGKIRFLSLVGVLGELGITPGHTPLLTAIKPGPAILRLDSGAEEVFFISGGFLEVQPKQVCVLADIAERASDIDEKAALEASRAADKLAQDKRDGMDYGEAAARMAEITGQMRALQALRARRGRGGR